MTPERQKETKSPLMMLGRSFAIGSVIVSALVSLLLNTNPLGYVIAVFLFSIAYFLHSIK